MTVRLSRMERREKTRQDLLNAAETCFVTRGFHATSVDEVAERAGYTKGAVYSNFASKEDLFLRGLPAAGRSRAHRGGTRPTPSRARTRVRLVGHGHDPAARQRRRLAGGLLRVLGARAAASRASGRFAASHARFLEPLTDAVRQLADDRGRALPSDLTPFQVVLAWNAMEVGLGLERLTQPQDVDVELARRMGWLLLDAVLGAAPPSASNDGKQQDRSTR